MWAKLNYTHGHSTDYNNLMSHDLHPLEGSKISGASGKILAQVGQEIDAKVFSKSMFDFNDPFLCQKAYTVMKQDLMWMTWIHSPQTAFTAISESISTTGREKTT